MISILLWLFVMIPNLSTAGVSQDTIEQLVSYYSDAAARVSAIVTQPGNSPAKIARAYQQESQIDAVLRQLRAQAANWTGPAINQAMAQGIARGNAQALEVGVDAEALSIDASFGLIDHATAVQFARDTAGDFYTAADNMGAQAKTVLRQTGQRGLNEADINKILAGGVIDGTPAQTIAALRAALQAVHGETVPITGKDGVVRDYDVAGYARTVARTKTRQATVQARHQQLSDMGLDLVRIVGRISTHFCTSYLNQVFSLSGKSDKYPALTELPSNGPPFHPNCSKSTAPFVEALASPEELDQAEGDDDQDAMLGIDAGEAAQRFKALGMGK